MLKVIGYIKNYKSAEITIFKWALDNNCKFYKDENNDLFIEILGVWHKVTGYTNDDFKALVVELKSCK